MNARFAVLFALAATATACSATPPATSLPTSYAERIARRPPSPLTHADVVVQATRPAVVAEAPIKSYGDRTFSTR